MANTRPRPRLLAGIVLAVLGAAVAIDAAAWWWAVRRIEAEVPGFVAMARSYGWEVAAGPGVRGGWPLAARVTLPNVTASRPLGAAALHAAAERLELEVALSDPGALHLGFPGNQTMALGDAAPVTLRAAAALLRIPFDGGPATLRLDGFEAGTAVARRVDAVFEAQAVQASAEGMQSRPPLKAPFDSGGRGSVRVEWAPAFPWAATPAESASAWQRAGGRVTVPALTLQWGTLDAEMHAEGGLDAALQPRAQGELAASGLPETLDAAEAAGLLPGSVGQASRAVLTLLRLRGNRVRLPVAVAEGRITVAGFPVLRLPPLDWR